METNNVKKAVDSLKKQSETRTVIVALAEFALKSAMVYWGWETMEKIAAFPDLSYIDLTSILIAIRGFFMITVDVYLKK